MAADSTTTTATIANNAIMFTSATASQPATATTTAALDNHVIVHGGDGDDDGAGMFRLLHADALHALTGYITGIEVQYMHSVCRIASTYCSCLLLYVMCIVVVGFLGEWGTMARLGSALCDMRCHAMLCHAMQCKCYACAMLRYADYTCYMCCVYVLDGRYS